MVGATAVAGTRPSVTPVGEHAAMANVAFLWESRSMGSAKSGSRSRPPATRGDSRDPLPDAERRVARCGEALSAELSAVVAPARRGGEPPTWTPGGGRATAPK